MASEMVPGIPTSWYSCPCTIPSLPVGAGPTSPRQNRANMVGLLLLRWGMKLPSCFLPLSQISCSGGSQLPWSKAVPRERAWKLITPVQALRSCSPDDALIVALQEVLSQILLP